MNRVRSATALIALFASSTFCVSVLGCEDGPMYPIRPYANLVANGGFERPRISGFEYDSYGVGQGVFGWTIDAGAVDHLSGRVWGPAEGTQSLDMDGSCGTGAIHQDLPTIASDSYELHFALSGNPNGPPVVKRLEVSWGSTVIDTVEFDTTGGSKGDPGWVSYDYTVIAPSRTTRLTFRSLSPGCYGALLDDVTVQRTPII